MEKWKPIRGWPYEVSSLGRVRRTLSRTRAKAGSIIKVAPKRNGYLGFTMCRDGIMKSASVSIEVCAAFHGPRPSPRHQAAHRNGTHTDNRATNLAWLTAKENEADKLLHGTAIIGSKHKLSKLTEEDASEIKLLLSTEWWMHKTIAEIFSISPGKVGHIKSGLSWRHINIRSIANELRTRSDRRPQR